MKMDAGLGYGRNANAPSFLVLTRSKRILRASSREAALPCERIIFICTYIVLILAIGICGTMVVS